MEHIYVQRARFACPHCGHRIKLGDVVEIDPCDDDEEAYEVEAANEEDDAD